MCSLFLPDLLPAHLLCLAAEAPGSRPRLSATLYSIPVNSAQSTSQLYLQAADPAPEPTRVPATVTSHLDGSMGLLTISLLFRPFPRTAFCFHPAGKQLTGVEGGHEPWGVKEMI